MPAYKTWSGSTSGFFFDLVTPPPQRGWGWFWGRAPDFVDRGSRYLSLCSSAAILLGWPDVFGVPQRVLCQVGWVGGYQAGGVAAVRDELTILIQ